MTESLLEQEGPELCEEETPTGRLPRIGEPAPGFTAPSTKGEISLSDFRGSWILLYCLPADFTPVCTTEIIALAEASKSFEDLGVEVLGLSIDSVQSHLAWLRSIEEKFAIKIGFPMISDAKRGLARRFGFVDEGEEDTAGFRGILIIDPDGIVQLVYCYPVSLGMSVEELVRSLRALKLTREKSVSTPEGWRPGDKVILPAPSTQGEAEERMLQYPGTVDWYFTLRDHRPKKAGV